jgi:hypothetical protein
MYKKHKRYNFCEDLEKDIQKRADYKDFRFRPKGKWKVFVRTYKGLKVYAVVGEWVRNNLSILMGHGGHGFVHEFIPMNEIWVDIEHYQNKLYDCGCNRKSGKVSEQYFNEVVRHEYAEWEEMAKGKPFWKAHQIALKKEKE